MNDLNEKSVDVAINAYGKPYQTAITILSLLKHSDRWIDKIYLVEEKKQPHNANFELILNYLGDRIIHYKPKFWLWTNKVSKLPLYFKWFRHAIRYQYAWEKTNKKYLLVSHNDVLYKDDLVKAYLENIGNHTGVGKIGQCWNCPAHHAQLCNGSNYTEFQPSYNELLELVETQPTARKSLYKDQVKVNKPWPLPECRLNEYVALINLDKAKPETIPFGKAMPFGTNNIFDTGVEWFSNINHQGHSFVNFDYDSYATHSWISQKNAGWDALFNDDLYHYEEKVALQYLQENYPDIDL